MMNNKFKGIKTSLSNIDFAFIEPRKEETINVKISDKISIIEIKDDSIDFYASRKLDFENLNNSHLEVKFKTTILLNDTINKNEFEDILKSNNNNLLSGMVFSKISLIISNLSSQSTLGIIVTPPFYNTKELQID